MIKEIGQNQQFQKVDLKEAIKQKLMNGLEQAIIMQLPEMSAYIQALQIHLENPSFAVCYTGPRTESEVNMIVGSSVAALHLAYARTGRDYEQLYGLTDTEEWQRIIQSILCGPETNKIFIEHLWRSPIVISPLRGVPLQYLLRFHFGDRAIRGIDLGAGLHIALPLLNSQRYLEEEFPEKEKIAQYAKPINIVTGLGVDKQDRHKSLEWASACYWPLQENRGAAGRLYQLFNNSLSKESQFPFLTADVTNYKQCIKHVKETVGEDGQVDFIFSSFLRHQLGANQLVQNSFMQLITTLMREGAIWVDIGEELIAEKQYLTSNVRVYGKKSNQVYSMGVPFILKGQTPIKIVNLEYFNSKYGNFERQQFR